MRNFTPQILMRHLCARNNLQYLSYRQLVVKHDEVSFSKGEDYYMYAEDRHKDRIFVWHVAFDLDGEQLLASELFAFDPLNAPASIPDQVLVEALKFQKARHSEERGLAVDPVIYGGRL